MKKYVYEIEGKKVEFDNKPSEAEIDEVGASIRQQGTQPSKSAQPEKSMMSNLGPIAPAFTAIGSFGNDFALGVPDMIRRNVAPGLQQEVELARQENPTAHKVGEMGGTLASILGGGAGGFRAGAKLFGSTVGKGVTKEELAKQAFGRMAYNTGAGSAGATGAAMGAQVAEGLRGATSNLPGDATRRSAAMGVATPYHFARDVVPFMFATPALAKQFYGTHFGNQNSKK